MVPGPAARILSPSPIATNGTARATRREAGVTGFVCGAVGVPLRRYPPAGSCVLTRQRSGSLPRYQPRARRLREARHGSRIIGQPVDAARASATTDCERLTAQRMLRNRTTRQYPQRRLPMDKEHEWYEPPLSAKIKNSIDAGTFASAARRATCLAARDFFGAVPMATVSLPF